MTAAARADSAPGRAQKRKRSVTLDADLVDTVGDDNLSSVVNHALRGHLEERRRLAALADWLDTMIESAGPLDEDNIARYMVLLGGPDDVKNPADQGDR